MTDNAKRDDNRVPTLIGVSNADGVTPVTIYVDPTTHRVLVSDASTAHDFLSATHTDTTAASPVLGDIVHGNATPKWARLAGNATTAKKFLTQTGDGAISAVPAWAAILAADVPDLSAAYEVAGSIATHAAVITGVHGLIITAGKTITVTESTTLGGGSHSGNNTGDNTVCTSGEATTAETLKTARTIGGVSFDGSANINLPGVNAAGNQDTSGKAATAGNADTVTNATLTTALVVDTGSVGLKGAGANSSVLTLGAGASSVAGANTGDETAVKIGALIGGADDATPNDSDFIATSLTAAGVLKKITWTNSKAFLKTYFDTLYGSSDISELPSDEDLVAHWKLNEGTGTAADSTFNKNDLVLTTATWGQGQVGNAIILNGSGGGWGLVTADAAITDIWDTGGAIAMWINIDSDGENNSSYLFNKQNFWRLNTISEASGQVKLRFNVAFSGTDGEWDTTALAVTLGEAALVEVSYDADAVGNDPTIRVNGVIYAVNTNSTPTGTRDTDVAANLYIGNGSGNNFTVDGWISSVRMYNRKLTTAESLALYNNRI